MLENDSSEVSNCDACCKLHGGRRYLVTGGARGIGRATAEVLLAHGAHVTIADIDYNSALETAQQIGANPIELDVTNRKSWEAARDALGDEYTGRLDGLVNNAGITRDKTLVKMDDTMWDAVIDTHLRGTWLGSQVLQPILAREKTSGSGPAILEGGAIVNISSSGRHGSFGQANYSAAKAGIIGLTKTTALEYARDGIRVNAVAPGPISTDMTAAVPPEVKAGWVRDLPLKRMGDPREIGEAVAFLLSPASSYMTGQVIDVNGGELHL